MPTRTITEKIGSSSSLLMDGPVSLRVVNGEASCFGKLLGAGIWVTIAAGRRVCVQASANASIEIALRTDGYYQKVDKSTIPGSWNEASQIVRQVLGTVAVLGGIDSGKSTLSTLLANEAISSNLSVGLVDADIGQADIGPPTTINGAVLTEQVYSLQDVSSQASFFVGDTSPERVTGKIVRGLASVRSHLLRSQVLIVNTDGWIDGRDAFNYKLSLLEKLAPNLVLAIETDDTPQQTLNELTDSLKCTVIKLGGSEYARRRSREERKLAREIGYSRFLRPSHVVELMFGSINVRRFDSDQTLLELPDNASVKGILSGLIDEDGMLVGICRILDATRSRVKVETSAELDLVSTLELGSVILSSDYEEVGFYPYM